MLYIIVKLTHVPGVEGEWGSIHHASMSCLSETGHVALYRLVTIGEDLPSPGEDGSKMITLLKVCQYLTV